MLLLVEDALTRYRSLTAPLLECHYTSKHHLQLYWLLPLLIDIPWFLNWGKTLLLYSSYLPLGVPNWTVKRYHHRKHQRCGAGLRWHQRGAGAELKQRAKEARRRCMKTRWHGRHSGMWKQRDAEDEVVRRCGRRGGTEDGGGAWRQGGTWMQGNAEGEVARKTRRRRGKLRWHRIRGGGEVTGKRRRNDAVRYVSLRSKVDVLWRL
jgi:hypothetical protein